MVNEAVKKWRVAPSHIILGPLIAVIVLGAVMMAGMPTPAAWTLAVVVWVAWWWITEALPLPVTSLLPFVLLPIGGILSFQESSRALGDPVIILFMGAFMLAKAVEVSGVHRRMALNLVSFVGASDGRRLVLSFMLASAILSMWISNTAAVLALLPVALALAEASDDHRFQRALLLGLAYSASLGGVATLIGTPPNLIFASIYEQVSGESFGFARWMGIGVPMVLLGLPVIGLWLTRGLTLKVPLELPKLGSISAYEKRVLMVFGAVIFLWVFRTEPFGGWTGLTGATLVGDSTIALAGVVAMFMVSNGREGRLLTWEQAVDIPWGILLLFAGGICLAAGIMQSGLGEIIGSTLGNFGGMPIWLFVFILTISVSFLTEVTSNTATATLLMPILAATAMATGLPIEVLMIPAAIACSCAFCLPVATPPNSIVFASGKVTIKEMSREGFVLNVMLAVITTFVVMILV
ncbi:sodium:dicarboxylate symporter [Aliidiomarina shirensis]|uniref:Sodium:dicarboxylate symporter n=1 Tax=Aliidiomarina shirensis TaxID=1048642 RepID=A0A432WUD3_9GAMM|nr:SLC13 family permease [Aliidiomarina shirensis]RUO37357.1 sodium:dicarboxylate symporter [Aliidiomarina shirensis]